MASYVVRLDTPDLGHLLQQWVNWGCQLMPLQPGQQAYPTTWHPGQPTLQVRQDVLDNWCYVPRFRWLWYCDNMDGITLRVYDRWHRRLWAGDGHYMEQGGHESEFVIVRGYDMGPSFPIDEGLRTCRLRHLSNPTPIQQHQLNNQLALDNQSQTPLKRRIRAMSDWRIWSGSTAPQSVTQDQPTVGLTLPESRLEYFEHACRNNAWCNGPVVWPPLPIDATWLTPDVNNIVLAILGQGDFAPPLRDALIDAGCPDHNAMIQHLQLPVYHGPDCWVVLHLASNYPAN